MSWIVLFKTWPSVSIPVMFGGGITIENGGFGDSGFATKSRFSSQRWYHFGSTAFGSYLLGSSAIALKVAHASGLRSVTNASQRLALLYLRITFPLHERPATDWCFRFRHR